MNKEKNTQQLEKYLQKQKVRQIKIMKRWIQIYQDSLEETNLDRKDRK